jgi:hypothetical protein
LRVEIPAGMRPDCAINGPHFQNQLMTKVVRVARR